MKPNPTYDIHRSYEANYQAGPSIREKAPQRRLTRRERFLGFEINSRIGIPAGPLLNARWIRAYAELGFDLLVYKTVRTCETPSHPNPNCMFLNIDDQIKEDDFGKPLVATMDAPLEIDRVSITNSFGMPSRAPEV
ncbi:MAG: dihydroorotate dehydrogenase, partial [Nitrospiria bacterium]